MAQAITPTEEHPRLAKAIGVSRLYFKREDLHPYHSHKGRSIPVMMDDYYGNDDRHFAISSSGNAALAAGLHMRDMNKRGGMGSLNIFVGRNITPDKLTALRKLADAHITVCVEERPRQAAFKASKDENRRLIRQGSDDLALIGYLSLAHELAALPDAGSVFMGVSSGATAQTLAGYFIDEKRAIEMHIVQTSSCHPMADHFGVYDGPDEKSIADAIVDKVALRKPKLIPLVEKTGGRGWCASNDEILEAQRLTKEHARIDISVNSALSVAGAIKAVRNKWKMNGAVVCLICGE